MAKFRTGNNRNNYDMDTDVSYIIRIYIFKNKSFPNENLFSKKTNIVTTEKAKTYLEKPIQICHSAMLEYFTRKSIKNRSYDLRRLQLFCNKKDNFYSIVLGYKVTPTKLVISELRYDIPLACFEGGYTAFYVSNYETHAPMSVWDRDHIQDGPVLDLKAGDANDFVTPLVDEKDETIADNKTVTVKNLILQISKNEEIILDHDIVSIFLAIKNVNINNNHKISFKSYIICTDHQKKYIKLYLILDNKNITKRRHNMLNFLKEIESKYNIKISGDVFNKQIFIDYLKKDLENDYIIYKSEEFENPK